MGFFSECIHKPSLFLFLSSHQLHLNSVPAQTPVLGQLIAHILDKFETKLHGWWSTVRDELCLINCARSSVRNQVCAINCARSIVRRSIVRNQLCAIKCERSTERDQLWGDQLCGDQLCAINCARSTVRDQFYQKSTEKNG
jgi:hypothetical protein